MYLYNVKGKVLTIVSSTEGILSFDQNGEEQRVLLLNDRIKCNGLDVPETCNISDYMKEGVEVTFNCQTLDENETDRWNWVAIICWVHKDHLINRLSDTSSVVPIRGKCSTEGTVLNISGSVGVLSFKDEVTDAEERVLFFVSALFLNDKRISKAKLNSKEIKPGTKLMFDAIPCDKDENDHECQWFATVSWKGDRKPIVPYDVIGTSKEVFQTFDLLAQMKVISLNPRTVFIRGCGHILHIFNDEYGLALGSIRPNRLDSILFHRNMCVLFKMNLSDQKLTEIFKEGDRISFIAVPAPKKFIVQWIATSISVHVDPSMKESIFGISKLKLDSC